MATDSDEEILKSWDFLICYRRHRNELKELAKNASLLLCSLYRAQYGRFPTIDECQDAFWVILHQHDLFLKRILVKEKPHTPSVMHLILGRCLARYVVRENWTYITSFHCP